MPPPVELCLLLLCARTRVGGDEAQQIRDLLHGELDWTAFVRAALHHHVVPLVARTLEATCPEAVPSDLLEALRLHGRHIREGNGRLTDELLALLHALRERGVSAVPFKGPMLAEQVYGDLGLRTFRDLDFLIERDDLPATLDVLRSRDYEVDSPLTALQLEAMRRTWGQDSFVRRDGRAMVEPHWALVPDKMALAIDYRQLRARCQPAMLKGVSVSTFAVEDLALVLAVHGAKELWWRLNWVSDIAELIAAFPSLDWRVALDRARRQGGGRMLLLAVALAHQLLGATLPPALVPALARDHVARGLADDAIRRLLDVQGNGAPTFNTLSGFRRRAHDGWRAQATYVLRTLCRPSSMHYEMIALPRRLSFGYYLVKAAHDYALLPAYEVACAAVGKPRSRSGPAVPTRPPARSILPNGD